MKLFGNTHGLRSLRSLLACLIFALTCAGGNAQFDSAAVVGSVHDKAGAALPGSAVTLINVDLGTRLMRTTDARGDYEFASVPTGVYLVSVAHAGFAPAESSRFDLPISARQRVDLTLAVGRVESTVTVEAGASLLQTETSSLDTVIDHTAMVDLPLNGRSYADLATLAPGVHQSSIEDGTINNREASYNVHGLRSTANNFLLDGLDNNAFQTENQGFSSQTIHPSPDALDQFRVETSDFSAEFGRVGGAVISATTRGGSNQVHGTIWEYLRNTDLNAYGPFQGTGVKPSLVQNQFGATVGGPIARDKAFFFLDYEGFRNASHTYTTVTLPTLSQAQGIFTNDLGEAVPVKNPFTGVTYKNGILPSTFITPFAAAVLQALPTPNFPGFSNNFSYLPASTNQNDKGDARFDEYLGSRLATFARFTKQSAELFAAPNIPGPAGGNSSGNIYARNTQLAAGATYTLSPNSLLDARVAFTWTQSGKSPVNLGQPSLLAQFNIPGIPTDPSVAGSLNVQSVSDFAAFGRQSSNPALVDPYTVNPKFSYTLTRGPHSLKFGYEYLSLAMGLADEYPLYGADTYSGKFSAAGGADQSTSALTTEANEAWYLADFLQGARSKYELSATQVFNYRQRYHFLYAQDNWKANNKLTLNLGLRYELVTPPWVDGNQLSNFDPATNTLVYASAGSLYNRSLIDIQTRNFAPRLGVAYSVNRALVLRGGYAISYVQGNRNGAEGTLAYNTVPDNVVSQTPVGNTVCPAGSNSTSCFRTTMEGYPSNFVAQQVNTATSIAEVRYVAKNDPTGYVESYHGGLETTLAKDTVLSADYVGAHGVHLRVLTDYNQALPYPGAGSTACPAPATGATPCATVLSRRPIQGFDSIIQPVAAGFLNYDSLEIKLRHHARFGLFLMNSFTYSRAFDVAGAQYEVNNGDGALVNKYNIAGDRGPSGYDQPLNDTTSFLWDLPFGRGRALGRSAGLPLRLLAGGWQIAGIERVTSGVPVNLTYSPASSASVTDASVSYAYRPNITGSVSSVLNPRSQWVKSGTALTNVYNTNTLSVPAATAPFGDVQRNALYGPAYGNLDLGVHKDFPLWREGYFVQFRAEAFNALNATNYKAPTANLSSTSFGSFSSTQVFPSRQLQLALRLSY